MRSVSAAPAVDAVKVPSRAIAITIRLRRAVIKGRERRRGSLKGDVIRNLLKSMNAGPAGSFAGSVAARNFADRLGWRAKFFMGAIARNSVLGTRGRLIGQPLARSRRIQRPRCAGRSSLFEEGTGKAGHR